jgi:hypothetical protein
MSKKATNFLSAELRNVRTLYRLKSNNTTIVRRFGPLHQRVVWTDTMAKYGVGDTWIISRFNPDNVIKLLKEEVKEIKKLIKNWR